MHTVQTVKKATLKLIKNFVVDDTRKGDAMEDRGVSVGGELMPRLGIFNDPRRCH